MYGVCVCAHARVHVHGCLEQAYLFTASEGSTPLRPGPAPGVPAWTRVTPLKLSLPLARFLGGHCVFVGLPGERPAQAHCSSIIAQSQKKKNNNQSEEILSVRSISYPLLFPEQKMQCLRRCPKSPGVLASITPSPLDARGRREGQWAGKQAGPGGGACGGHFPRSAFRRDTSEWGAARAPEASQMCLNDDREIRFFRNCAFEIQTALR